MESNFPKKLLPFAASVLSGILYAFSFPAANLYLLAWIALVPLFYALNSASIKRAAFLGFIAGFTGSALLIYWFYTTMYIATGSVLQSVICLILAGVYLALYPSVWAAGMWFLLKRTSPLLFSFVAAAAWVSLEYLRSTIVNGFTWGFLGYSQSSFLPALQTASLGGVFSVSFLVVLANAGIFQFFRSRKKLPLVIIVLIVLSTAAWGNLHFRRVASAYHPEVVVAGLQGNIDQYKKFDQAFQSEITHVYERLVRSAAVPKPAFIVWPETSAPGFLPDDAGLSSWLSGLARESNAFQIVGAAFRESDRAIYNASFAVTAAGNIAGIHKKTHLVLFGEYVPFRSLISRYFSVLDTIGDLARGTEPEVFTANGIRIGPTICSENFSGERVRRSVLKGAEVIVNQTNDAWYGHTSEQGQHFVMNIFRAVENQRAVVVAGNNGQSGIIDPTGKVSVTLPLYAEGFFSGKIAPVSARTFYTNHGDVFVRACILITLITFVVLLLMKLFGSSEQDQGIGRL